LQWRLMLGTTIQNYIIVFFKKARQDQRRVPSIPLNGCTA
jgi:hypothetical protein